MRNRTWLKVQKCRSDLNCLKSSRIEEWVLATGILNTLSCVESKGFANRCWRKFRHHKTRCVRRGIDVIKLLVSIKLTVIKSFFYFFDFPETPWVAVTSICCNMAEGWRSQYLGIAPESTSEANYGKYLANNDRSGVDLARPPPLGLAEASDCRSWEVLPLVKLTLASLASPALAISLTHDDKLQNVFGDFLAWSCKIILLGDCCYSFKQFSWRFPPYQI